MRKIQNRNIRGIAYGFIHFSVETACFFLMFSRRFGMENWALWSLAYDALAFLPQAAIGLFADRARKFPLGAAGTVLLALGLFCPGDLPALLLASVGNCALHVAGAENTLRGSDGKLLPAAVFVGGGSFGVIFGQLLGKTGQKTWILVPAALLAVTLLLLWLLRGQEQADAADFSRTVKLAPCGEGGILALASLTVALRAYIGYAVPMSWNNSTADAVFLFCMMGVGKIAGGYFADRFGAGRTGVVSLLCSLPFLLVGDRCAPLSVLGVTLFSMTMSISLGMLTAVLPDRPGFAFGVTTVALFVGTAPAFFFLPQGILWQEITVCGMTLTAAAAMYVCFFSGRKRGSRK